MKIAVITSDSITISQHLGRAPYYLVFTVDDGQIAGKELRDKVGHRQFANEPHEHNITIRAGMALVRTPSRNMRG